MPVRLFSPVGGVVPPGVELLGDIDLLLDPREVFEVVQPLAVPVRQLEHVVEAGAEKVSLQADLQPLNHRMCEPSTVCTAEYADIMYSFQHGGDIEKYFLRYRKRLKNLANMRERSPLSGNDIAQLRALH